ncbi:unnamed protein product, partial [Didymodactylos carnosus]
PKYKPEEWLDIRIGNATYVRFIGDTYDESLSRLFELIFINERNSTKRKPSEFYPSIDGRKRSTVNAEVASNTSYGNTVDDKPVVIESEQQIQPTSQSAQTPDRKTPKSSRGNIPMKFRFPSISQHFYQKSIHDWTSDDVKQWFLHEKLSLALCELYSFSNGDALLTYTKLVLNDKSKLSQEYDTISKRLDNDAFYRDHFANFISAAENLMSQFDKKNMIRNTELPSCIVS